MPNYFSDNTDLQFHFSRFDLKEILEIAEDNFSQAKEFEFAPKNYEDGMDNFRKVLEVVGDLAGNFISERAADVDTGGAHFNNGKVTYAEGTKKNLKQIAQADLAGMILPRRFGGLNFPFTIYILTVEILARADASLMNIFGLQDIAETINKFGDEEQRKKFIPKFSTGEHTGAMALTEPDAGSDLQSCRLTAYKDENSNWYLKGMKRFITNGNGDVLLVLARSEPNTTDGRGLSMFACFSDKTVKVRRIEHKLGINGSPTCELQFNDTPAVLVGKRRFGLIKYVLHLMYRARMGISAQAIGISEAAYQAALKYAKEREQFGKTIFELPVIKNMLFDMKVLLQSSRSLLYDASQFVDIKEKLEDKIEKLKTEGKSYQNENKRLKEITKIANFLTPISKYIITEAANKITYDAIQIHGGTGYMKEFAVERLARDARITNIYEGTSQLQIVAAIGGVTNDIFKDYFTEKADKNYKPEFQTLSEYLKEIRKIFEDSFQCFQAKNNTTFQDAAAKDLVDIYSSLYVGYLLLEEAEKEPEKVFIARRYIITSLANAKKSAETIRCELYDDLVLVQNSIQV